MMRPLFLLVSFCSLLSASKGSFLSIQGRSRYNKGLWTENHIGFFDRKGFKKEETAAVTTRNVKLPPLVPFYYLSTTI